MSTSNLAFLDSGVTVIPDSEEVRERQPMGERLLIPCKSFFLLLSNCSSDTGQGFFAVYG